MKSPFYNTYLYNYPQGTTYERIERDLQQLGSNAQISVHDLSDTSKEDQIHVVDNMFTAERMRMYEAGKQKECYVHIVRHDKDGYLAIISIYPYGSYIEYAAKSLYAITRSNKVSYIDTGTDKDTCEKYWLSYMKEFAHTGKYIKKDTYTLDGDEMFPIDIDRADELKEMFVDDPMRAKALLSCAFSRVACAGARQDSVIVEDHICNGRLNRLPVRFCDLTSEIPINNAEKDFGNAFSYSNITYDDVRSLTKINLDEFILYSQTVLYDKMYTNIFANAKTGILYRFDALEFGDVPLFIVFHMDGEMSSVQYLYDTAFFRDFSVEGLHNAFQETLSKLIRRDYTVTEYKQYLKKNVSNDDKRFDAIANCLKKSGWFEKYSDSEILTLAKKCQVKRLFHEQNFIDSGTTEDAVYLLVHGKVEVVGRDFSNVLHSLRLIKEMNFFGIESISDKPTATDDYQVMTDDALAVVIDKEIFLQEAAKHNELFVKAITLQDTNLVKYQKLWMMS